MQKLLRYSLTCENNCTWSLDFCGTICSNAAIYSQYYLLVPAKRFEAGAEQQAVPCTQIDKCFGFDTAVEEAQRALLAAKVEATSAYKGIGLVKLMGRQSGFIAMQASMASGMPFFLCILSSDGGLKANH